MGTAKKMDNARSRKTVLKRVRKIQVKKDMKNLMRYGRDPKFQALQFKGQAETLLQRMTNLRERAKKLGDTKVSKAAGKATTNLKKAVDVLASI